ncbi:MAG: cell division protein FtsQ/DivIB, partial [Nitrococcus sp.]|nr:cell division protein FtsQ/DivIB [Nitrococcus sp.]
MESIAGRWSEDARQAPPLRAAPIRRLAMAVLVALVIGGGMLVLRHLSLAQLLPLHSVVLEGELIHVSEARLRSAIGPLLQRGLLGVDVTAIRLAVEALPWIDHATVHRLWPDALRISLVEQVAVARWGEAALLNYRGEVFRPSDLPEGLPRLVGPKGSESRMLRQFHQFHTLLHAVGLSLTGLVLDARRSWTAELGDGSVVRIGREHIKARMRQLAAVWPRIAAASRGRALLVADLRYPNGLSIRWRGSSEGDSSRGAGQ